MDVFWAQESSLEALDGIIEHFGWIEGRKHFVEGLNGFEEMQGLRIVSCGDDGAKLHSAGECRGQVFQSAVLPLATIDQIRNYHDFDKDTVQLRIFGGGRPFFVADDASDQKHRVFSRGFKTFEPFVVLREPSDVQ